MNYTIDAHTKRDKLTEERKDEDGKVIKDKDGKVVLFPMIIKDPVSGKPMAKVKTTDGFIVRADDAFVKFVETKEEAVKLIAQEQKTPSVVPGMALTIESHTKREKQFDKDDAPIIDPKTKRVMEKVTPGFQLRAGDKVVMWSEKKEDLVAKIQEITGISDPVAAVEKVKPAKKESKRERKTGNK